MDLSNLTRPINTIANRVLTLNIDDIEHNDLKITADDYIKATLLFPAFYPLIHMFTIPAVFLPTTEQKYFVYDRDDGLTNMDSKKITVIFGGNIVNANDIYNITTNTQWMNNLDIVPHDTNVIFVGYNGVPKDYDQEALRTHVKQVIYDIYEIYPDSQIVSCSGHSMGGLMATEMHLQLQERMDKSEILDLEAQGYNTLIIDRSFSYFNYQIFKYNFYRFLDSQLVEDLEPQYRNLLELLMGNDLQISDAVAHILLQWSETELVNPICSADPEIRARVDQYIDRNNVSMVFAKHDKTVSFNSQQELLKCMLELPKHDSLNKTKFFLFDNTGCDTQMNPHQLPLFLARPADLNEDDLLEEFDFDYYNYCTNFPYPKESNMESYIEHYNHLYDLYMQGLII